MIIARANGEWNLGYRKGREEVLEDLRVVVGELKKEEKESARWNEGDDRIWREARQRLMGIIKKHGGGNDATER